MIIILIISFSLEKKIHDVMHKAFWDVLEEEIKSEPPQFKHAFDLLIEMKTVSSSRSLLNFILLKIAFYCNL